MEHVEIVWEGKGRAAKAYAPGLGCRDTLRLSGLAEANVHEHDVNVTLTVTTEPFEGFQGIETANVHAVR